MKANSKVKLFITHACFSALLLLQGCGTLATHDVPPFDALADAEDKRGVFRGTRFDLNWYRAKNWHADPTAFVFFGLTYVPCDLALSLCMDVVFLPYDILNGGDTTTYEKPLEVK